MNCNAVYEVEISSNDFNDAYLNASAFKTTPQSVGNNDILLSTCTDYDLFTEAELVDFINNGANWNPNLYDNSGEPKYYPSK